MPGVVNNSTVGSPTRITTTNYRSLSSLATAGLEKKLPVHVSTSYVLTCPSGHTASTDLRSRAPCLLHNLGYPVPLGELDLLLMCGGYTA